MTALHRSAPQVPAGMGVAHTQRALLKINEPGCVAAVWLRDPLPTFRRWLEAQKPETLPRARVVLRADAVGDALAHLCNSAGVPDCPERDMLEGDIAALACMFADLADVAYLRLHLGSAPGMTGQNACADSASIGLVCTYRGSGLQFRQGCSGSSAQAIYSVPTCAPVVMRGPHSSALSVAGLHNVTPPACQADETRFAIALEPVADVQDRPVANTLTIH